LGFASKQQALFYVPLLIGVGWLSAGVKSSSLIRFFLPILFGVVILFVWDSARGEVSGVWAVAAANNDPGGFARAEQLVPRGPQQTLQVADQLIAKERAAQ
jgi:hypothetical protein